MAAALTHCEMTRRSKRQMVSLGRLAWCGLWCAACAGFALLHVYVQFKSSDMRLAARQIQNKREALENRVNELTTQLEQLRAGALVSDSELAARYGLCYQVAEHIERRALPIELAMKYEDRAWTGGEAVAVAAAAPSGGPLMQMVAGLAGRLGGGAAFAAQP